MRNLHLGWWMLGLVTWIALGMAACEKSKPVHYQVSQMPLVYKYWLTQQTEIQGQEPVRNMIVGELDVSLEAKKDNRLHWRIALRDFVIRAMVQGKNNPSIKKVDLSKVQLELVTEANGQMVSLSDPSGHDPSLNGVLVAVRQSFLDWVPQLPTTLTKATAWSVSLNDHLLLPPFESAPVNTTSRFHVNSKQAKAYGEVWRLGARQDLTLGKDAWLVSTEETKAGPTAQASNRLRFMGKGQGESSYEFRPADGRLIWSRMDSKVDATTEVDGASQSQMQQTIKTTMEVFLKEADRLQRAKQAETN